ncbi:MAG: TonB-dependent receptor [Bacteroidales bacterium]|nr:TonB-dependent receptor [Bacteroidales bacterium]
MKYLYRLENIKNRVCKVVILLIVSFGFVPIVSAQYILKGKIIDAETKEAIWEAHVLPDCKDGSVGVISDKDGNFVLKLASKECEVLFRYIGYESITKKVVFNYSKVITLKIEMHSNIKEIGKVVVEQDRYEMKKDESISSIDYVGAKYIQDNNIVSLDDAFDKTGGLIIVDNEPQMRGGSGFSSGMGSRVMIMMDEMPVMRVDAGRPAWNLIPMENIEQIEVLKGAASVLYGSSAITGAINVKTAYPKGNPEWRFSSYVGMYSRPEKDYRCSWKKGTVPLTGGASLSHSRRIGKKFDLVFSAEYAYDDGYVNYDSATGRSVYNPIKERYEKPSMAAYQEWMSSESSFDFDTNYQKLVKEKRVRFNVGTRYRATENLSFGINANVMYSENTMTHFWLNADNGMYNAFPGSVSEIKDLMFFIDPYLKYYAKNNQSHSIKSRIMYSDNDATNNQDSKSEMYYLEYQYAKMFKKAGDLQLFAGIVGQFARSRGNVFSGISILDTTSVPKPKYSGNGAVYVQLEKKFLKQKNLTILGGARYEYFQIFEKPGYFLQDSASGNYVEAKPVFRAGINYTIVKTYTSFRASFGQGYRFPSIGERYLTTKVGNYGFYPNPDLKSETSWNVEFGVQQLFKLLDFEGYFDIAGYYQKYKNYVEFFLGPWVSPDVEPSIIKRYGFKFFNTGPARIAGVDISIAGEGHIGKHVKYIPFFAYSYTNPKVEDTGYVFTSTKTKDYTYMNTSSDVDGQIMKYRIAHILKFDLDFKFFDIFTIGGSIQYYSLMKNVDHFFYTMDRYSDQPQFTGSKMPVPFDGLEQYRKEHQKGTCIFGLRASIEVWNLKLSVLVNNLLNKEYSLRPMAPEAPRLTTIQLSYKFKEGEPLFQKDKYKIKRQKNKQI